MSKKLSLSVINELDNKEVSHNLEGLEFVEMDGHFYVSTKSIEKVFEKRHDKVLRSVDDLLTSAEFGELKSTHPKIGLSAYEDNSGKSNKMYLLDRDAFSLIVMGFTGKKALVFKIKYIEGFNKLEVNLIETQKLLISKDNRIKELEKLTHNLPRDIKLWEKQLIPMEKIENSLSSDYRTHLRQSTIVRRGSKADDYALIEKKRNDEITKCNRDFAQRIKGEHTQATNWMKSFNSKRREYADSIRLTIKLAYELGRFANPQLEEELKAIRQEKIDNKAIVKVQYIAKKRELENQRDNAIKAIMDYHEFDINLKKQIVDRWFDEKKRLHIELKANRITHDEVIKFLSVELKLDGFTPQPQLECDFNTNIEL